jgi:hypothetical protein
MTEMEKSEKPKTGRNLLAAGRRELKEIIETCDAIEERQFNPFFLDVNLGVQTLREYFPHWEGFKDHCLDAHAINRLSEVVRLQNTQLKFQSTALYAEPEFISRKIERMSEKRLAEVFLQSWHPLTELEQLTEETVSSSLDYWNVLLPIQERWKRREYERGKAPTSADNSVLDGLGIHGKEFAEQMTGLWKELQEIHNTEQKPVEYWSFVRRANHQDTVQRAYFVSFLITYGYAKLQTEGDAMTLIPNDQPTNKAPQGGVSFPIPIPIPKEGQAQ